MAQKKTKATEVCAEHAPVAEVITAYKGFDKDLKCRGFQYEIGKTYIHKGKVEACSSGFHACENPFDVWSYYSPVDNKFAVVEMRGELSRHGSDSKIASGVIEVKAEIGLPTIISVGISYLIGLCKDAFALEQNATDASQLAASGNDSKLAASGYASKLAASGNDSQLAASGNASKLAASGNASKLAASGYDSVCVSAAIGSMASAGENGAIALTYHDGSRYRISVAYVGENGIKPNVWYSLNENGEFVEAP